VRVLKHTWHKFSFCVAVVWAGALPVQAATSYTWTNTAGADYWTNNANWSPVVTYPGADPSDSALLTNQVSLAYTNILDTGLANPVSVLAISNPLGEAWLRVLNTTLTNTSLTLGTGGRLQIAGGVVTGVTTLAWTGNNGALWLDNGGKFFTSGAKTIGAAGGITALVTSANSPGTWYMNAGGLTIGGASGHDNLLTIDSGVVLTNVAGITHAGNRNSLIITGGSELFGSGGLSFNNAGYGNTITIGGGLWNGIVSTLAVGGGVNSSNHTLNVTGGSVSNFLALQVGVASGANYNNVTVTGGSLIMTNRGTSQVQVGSASGGGSGGSFNNVVVTNGILVSGTDNISYVGYNSASNSLTLLSGSVWQISSQGSASPGQLTIGFGAATGNVVILNGGITTNGQGAGSMANGPSIVIGNGAGSFGNMLIVTNDGRLLVSGGGIRVGTNGATGNRLVLDGGNSSGAVVFDSGQFVIGSAGSGGNALSATNARLTTGATTIGSGSSNNSAYVAENVTWNLNGAALTIGTGEAVNNLLTNHGGTFTNVGAVIVGNGAAAAGNGLVIDNGGTFRSTSITVGNTGGAQSNYLIIGGVGSTTIVTNGLITIGAPGAGFNTMTVTNARVFSLGLSIGAKSSNNTVTVFGDTVWNLRNDVVSVGDASGSGGANVMSSTGNILVVNSGILTNANGVNVGDMGGNMNTAFNTLIITNGGQVFNNGGVIIGDTTPGAGLPFASSNNTLIVTGSGSLMTNAGNLFLGYNATAGTTPGGSNRLTIADGAKFILSGAGTIGYSTTGSGGGSNTVVVTDTGSVWSNGGALTIANGVGGVGNRLLITNGGAVAVGTTLTIAPAAASAGNDLTVTGPDSRLTIGGNLLLQAGNFNTINVTAGGRLTQFGTLSLGNTGSSNTLTVSGLNSVYQFIYSTAGNAVRIGGGANATGNQMIIRDGGMVVITNSFGSANSFIGGGAGAKSNSVLVTGPGSTWTNLTAGATVPALVVGAAGAVTNSLTISDQGAVIATAITVGGGAGGNNNSVFIDTGGLLQANTLTIGAGTTGNTISNVGGIYQFTQASPVITTNNGVIALTDGTISFHGISSADVTNNLGNGALKGITFAGANTFMLNAASNTTAGQTYTFQTVAGNPSNYVSLAMINGATAYRGGDLTIGQTGSMLISSTTASVTGLFTNQGQAKLVGSVATFASGVINSGGLSLQNATLVGGVTNQSTGTLRGNGLIVGDVVSFGTNSPGFSAGTLAITGSVTFGSSAVTVMELFDAGSNDLITVSGTLTFGGQLVVTNVTDFGFAAGQSFQLFQSGIFGGEFGATNLPDLAAFSLTWDTSQLGAQGLLSIAVVPEPSTFVLLGCGLLGLWMLRRRQYRC